MTSGSDPAAVLAVAAALGLERIFYIWVERRPGRLRALCARWPRWPVADPVTAVSLLFIVFKGVQAGVFAAWCVPDFGRWALGAGWPALGLGGILLTLGQALNLSVFWRLGATGVFYGARFGHAVPWQRGLPFSLLRHPQYVGTVMSIWGLFLLLRAPAPGWWIPPAIETGYYVASALVEA